MVDRRIKILFLIGSFGTGGKERQLAELIYGLDNERFEMHLMIKSDGAHYLEKIKTKVKAIYNINRERFGLKALRDISGIISDIKPDIVHSWSDSTSFFSIIIKYFMIRKFRIIDGSIRSSGPGLGKFSINFLLRKAINQFSDLVVANSHAGLSVFKVPPDRGLVVYNGFDFSRLESLTGKDEMKKSLGLKDEFVIGMVARFEPQKDWDKFLRIAREFTGKHDNTVFICCGGGPELEKFRTENVMYAKKILFTGKRPDIESVINIFDLGVLISNKNLHGEGISNSILECMALGKPVIANDSGGNMEIICNHSVGRIIKDDRDEKFITAMEEFMHDPLMAATTGNAAKERIRDHFSYNKMLDNYSEIYSRLKLN